MGWDVFSLRWQTMFSAENPYAASSSAEVPPSPLAARRQLLPVAVGLLVTSILHIFGGLFYFVFVYSVVAAPDADPEGTHDTLVYCMYMESACCIACC